jgi:cytoskeletal protein CcmA (bactofilin family)
MPPETSDEADAARDVGEGSKMSRRGRRQGDRSPNEPSEPGEPGIRETLGPEMTVVGRGAQLEGTLVSTESIRIDGQAKGKIAARVDVILSSHSHVEADIQAQNVVAGGTLMGSITARTMTEVTEGGRVEGTIRSKALVVREGALFSGQASIDLQDATGGPDGSAYPEDELRTGYEESVRRTAEWYRSTLLGPTAEPDHGSVTAQNADGISGPGESTPDLGHEAALSGLGPARHNGSESAEAI